MYVDDPISSFLGDREQVDRNVTKWSLGLLARGFELAFQKLQDSLEESHPTWTSAVLQVDLENEAVPFQVTDDIVAEVKDTVEQMVRYSTIDSTSSTSRPWLNTCPAPQEMAAWLSRLDQYRNTSYAAPFAPSYLAEALAPFLVLVAYPLAGRADARW